MLFLKNIYSDKLVLKIVNLTYITCTYRSRWGDCIGI